MTSMVETFFGVRDSHDIGKTRFGNNSENSILVREEGLQVG